MTYDSWKLATPPECDEADPNEHRHGDEECACDECTSDRQSYGELGPNGCTCGFNGDCNCPFVVSTPDALRRGRGNE